MILSYIRQICIRQKLKHGLPSIFLYFIFSGFLWNTSILKFHFIFLVSIIYAKHTRDKSKKIIIIYYIINYDAIILRPWNLNVDVNSSIVRSIWFFFSVSNFFGISITYFIIFIMFANGRFQLIYYVGNQSVVSK